MNLLSIEILGGGGSIAPSTLFCKCTVGDSSALKFEKQCYRPVVFKLEL